MKVTSSGPARYASWCTSLRNYPSPPAGTFIHYAKPASILRSYELYLKENSGGNKDNLRLLLSVSRAAGRPDLMHQRLVTARARASLVHPPTAALQPWRPPRPASGNGRPCWSRSKACLFNRECLTQHTDTRRTPPRIPQTWLAASALGTWEWKGLFATLQGILEESYTQANDTMKPAVQSQIRTLETRARSFWEADVSGHLVKGVPVTV